MRQITVISGKGGTGKTSIVGAFASLAKNKVLADCDVDAADLHLLMSPKKVEEYDFKALQTAQIDYRLCNRCGLCERECAFEAIKDFVVDPLACEGCGVCEYVCPKNAVEMKDKVAGKVYVSQTRFGLLAHARLNPGEEASGKLVTEVREKARDLAKKHRLGLVLIDGSPGIGCPVIASIGGVDLVLVVAEPTVSGIHDLKRILDVSKHFKLPAVVCVNKSDINLEKAQDIRNYCEMQKIEVVGDIPYDTVFTKAMIEGKTIMEYTQKETASRVAEIWSRTEEVIDELPK